MIIGFEKRQVGFLSKRLLPDPAHGHQQRAGLFCGLLVGVGYFDLASLLKTVGPRHIQDRFGTNRFDDAVKALYRFKYFLGAEERNAAAVLQHNKIPAAAADCARGSFPAPVVFECHPAVYDSRGMDAWCARSAARKRLNEMRHIIAVGKAVANEKHV